MGSKSLGPYVLPVSLILGGLVCLAISASGNFDTSQSWAATSRGQAIYGAAALVVDIVVVALFACVVGVLCRNGRYWAGAGMSLVVALGMGLSMVTFYQFGIKERVTPSQIAQKQHNSVITADAQTLARKDAVTQSLLSDLQGEAERTSDLLLAKQANVNREVARSELLATRNKKTEIAFANIEVKPEPIFIDPDSGASGLASDTGLTVATVQKALTLALGSLLILAKALAFGFGFGMWPKSESVSTEVVVASPPPPQLLEAEVIPRQRVEPIDQVYEFYIDATRDSPAGLPIRATELHSHYHNWAQQKNYFPLLSIQGFGRASISLIDSGKVNLHRKITQLGIEYVGRTPVIFEQRNAA